MAHRLLELAPMTSTHPIAVIAGLDPATSIRMARCSIIEMAGTSPAMTIPRG
jgi:hypothetical protein